MKATIFNDDIDLYVSSKEMLSIVLYNSDFLPGDLKMLFGMDFMPFSKKE